MDSLFKTLSSIPQNNQDIVIINIPNSDNLYGTYYISQDECHNKLKQMMKLV